MLELLGMDFDIPYDKGPFYAVLFSIAIVILLIGYFNRKKANFKDDSDMNFTLDNTRIDVLGQPIQSIHNNQFPKEGVLFNNGEKSNVLQSFLISLAAFILFGLIVGLLQ